MEITEFLKAARSRVWLIIALPLVSAAVACGVLLAQPVQYTASATVEPSALIGASSSQYVGAQAVTQFVAAFQSMASGPRVRNEVAADTGIRPGAVTKGLSVTQRGGSASILLTYSTPDKSKAEPVVQALTSRTLTAMFSPQVAMANTRLQGAQKVLDEANAAVAQFLTTVKMADPQRAYESQLSRVNSLVQQQALLRANGNAVGAAALSASITSANASLGQFGKILSDYNALTQRQSLAQQGVLEAQAALAGAKAQVAAADPSTVAFLSGVRGVDREQPVLQAAIAVATAAFLLALLLVFIGEVVRRSRAGSAASSVGEPVPSAVANGKGPSSARSNSIAPPAKAVSAASPQSPRKKGQQRPIAGSRQR